MSTLYVVGTPIGNLADITLRALEILKSVGTIACEDTRVTSRLLARYQIQKPLISVHQYSRNEKLMEVCERLARGEDVAYVTDAGTPTISDPGAELVAFVIGHAPETKIIPIPGASAVTTALCISGKPADEFLFLGFPPHKKGRKTFFDKLALEKRTVVFYESTHRILKALAELEKRTPDRRLVVCRELTKLHETTYRGTPAQVTEQLARSSIKGEFVIVL
ncbi:MAG: 16S rRNA (cytidine(1402)-2'-O)-methyltransferase [Patescibacteria group bacterium]